MDVSATTMPPTNGIHARPSDALVRMLMATELRRAVMK